MLLMHGAGMLAMKTSGAVAERARRYGSLAALATAVLFVIARVLYLLLYWIDLAWQRSLVWVVGLLCSLLLMLSPALA